MFLVLGFAWQLELEVEVCVLCVISLETNFDSLIANHVALEVLKLETLELLVSFGSASEMRRCMVLSSLRFGLQFSAGLN